MALGRKITLDVKRRIGEIKLGHFDWTAKEVQAAIIKELGGGSWPGLSAVQKLTNFPKPKPGETKELGEDAPWSLGVSVSAEHGIPPEAVKDLMQVWRWCLAVGLTFTIREAKWVVWLRGTVPGIKSARRPQLECVGELYRWAGKYALRERASLLLGENPPHTEDLDHEMLRRFVMEFKEGRAAEITGALREPDLFQERDLELLREKGAAAWPRAGACPCWEVESDLQLKELPYCEREDVCPPYAYLLRYAGKGPEWEAMSQEQRLNTARRLRQLVEEWVDEKAGPTLRDLTKGFWRPAEILRKVGIDVKKGGQG